MPSLIHHVRRHADKWVSIFVGTTVFLLLVGPQVLWPTYTMWMRWGDSAQHYYGWEFFRRSPLLQFPLGESPGFGVGYASSVVYTDSIPLLAIPLKYLTFWFDADFQYFGVWLLFCYVAQHFVALRLLRRLGSSIFVASVGATFFVIAPLFLFRQTILGYGHMALVGHFLLLTAFLLAINGSHRTWQWVALLATSVLVQFYLFVMVALVWAFVMVRLITSRTGKGRQIVIDIGVTVGVVVLVMWSAGYFSAGNSAEEGFGIFRADLATFLDPETFTTTKWSSIVPNQPVVPNNVDGTFEGFAFLGTGILLASLWAVVSLVSWRRPLWTPSPDTHSHFSRLFPVAILCFVFSLSNNITFRVERFLIPLPGSLEWLGNTLRASGRFVWPLAYVLMLYVIVNVSRTLPPRVSAVIIVLLLAVQVIDSRIALRETRERFDDPSYEESILQSIDWQRLAKGRSRLIIDPPQYKGFVWQDFAEFALREDMTTNASYLSRVDYQRLYESEVRTRNSLLTRQLSPDTLYVVMRGSGAYASLRNVLDSRDGALAPGVDARFIDGMLAVVVKP